LVDQVGEGVVDRVGFFGLDSFDLTAVVGNEAGAAEYGVKPGPLDIDDGVVIDVERSMRSALSLRRALEPDLRQAAAQLCMDRLDDRELATQPLNCHDGSQQLLALSKFPDDLLQRSPASIRYSRSFLPLHHGVTTRTAHSPDQSEGLSAGSFLGIALQCNPQGQIVKLQIESSVLNFVQCQFATGIGEPVVTADLFSVEWEGDCGTNVTGGYDCDRLMSE